VASPLPSDSRGSRTAAYLVAGGLATIPGLCILIGYLGPRAALGAVVVLWTSGIVWLLKKRQEDPAWDRRPPTGRRT
jgi:uncharacterized membrane protein YphA (DoxX/SURF4 family)